MARRRWWARAAPSVCRRLACLPRCDPLTVWRIAVRPASVLADQCRLTPLHIFPYRAHRPLSWQTRLRLRARWTCRQTECPLESSSCIPLADEFHLRLQLDMKLLFDACLRQADQG